MDIHIWPFLIGIEKTEQKKKKKKKKKGHANSQCCSALVIGIEKIEKKEEENDKTNKIKIKQANSGQWFFGLSGWYRKTDQKRKERKK